MATYELAVPALPVSDVSKACAFYRDRLGFAVGYQADHYAILDRDRIEVHLWPATDTDWQARATAEPIKSGAETFLAGTASCRIKTDDVDALHAACEGHGIVHPQGSLEDKPYGLREFTVRDPDGNNVTFYQRIV